jgi:hypothetical protein
MKIVRLAVILVLIFSIESVGQQLGRVTSGVDVGLGYKEDAWVPSAMYHQELSLNHFPWFRIGWGVRGAGYYASQTNLAPKNTAMSGDTLKFGKITTNTISFLVGANVRLWKFDIGANTDLFGFAFGTKRRGLYSAGRLTDGAGSKYYNDYVPSSPSPFNVVPLVLDNQNGQSELFLRYWITDRIGLKVGYVHGRVTYTSSEKLDNGQNRFSTSYSVPYVAIAFPLYN